ncbi:ATP-dependent Clp protease proteolytic subunit [Plasmodium gonderi]|uniref:ATP-dependent Clp protease proteolytic subunit n=1 Tax=Plasmodium gonderi TaxID=77519 RepID=A0A1Y1JK47_PLAGO|nr:ATP-dependent Clp protease proteolytic subunit [Plasmodium gonderi]GAW82869.1 ATP-dependent Clp protease proteolytic subunit [Plasmodium gonderi]
MTKIKILAPLNLVRQYALGSRGKITLTKKLLFSLERKNKEGFNKDRKGEYDCTKKKLDKKKDGIKNCESESSASKKDSDASRKNSDASKKDSDASRKNSDASKKNSDASRKNSDASRKNSDASRKNSDSFKKTVADLANKFKEKSAPNMLTNLVITILKESSSELSEKEKKMAIDKYKEIACEYLQRGGYLNSRDKKNDIKFVDIFATLYLCYREKIFDLDFLTKVNEAFEILLKNRNEKEILNDVTINYWMIMFYYFSFLNMKNMTMCNKIRDFIMNNEVKPLVIYKYLECLSLLSVSNDRKCKQDTFNHIITIIQIFYENFYNFNNYLVLHILYFLHNLNFANKDIFLFLTKKINKNVYNENANRFELCMLARIYALYKIENITFINYVCEDLIRSLTKYEDDFQNYALDENFDSQGDQNKLEDPELEMQISGRTASGTDATGRTASGTDTIGRTASGTDATGKTEKNMEIRTTDDDTNICEQRGDSKWKRDHPSQNDGVYTLEIENINRQNYAIFKHNLYNDGLSFYSFFANCKTTNRKRFMEKENSLNMIFVKTENKEKSCENVNTSVSEWHKLFVYDEHKEKDIKNEQFVELEDTEKKKKNDDDDDDQIIDKYNKFLKENLHYEFDHNELIELFKNASEHMDNTKIDFIISNVERASDIYDERVNEYKKKLLFIENYYIGHIFHIVDSLLSLKVHHNYANFKKLENKILNLVKNNENYIIDNFDSNEIKSLIIFLSHANRHYKEAFIYCLTHRMVDLYMNNLCKSNVLSIFLYNLLNFTKKKVVKKNKFNHTIRNVLYDSYSWLNDNKYEFQKSVDISTHNSKQTEKSNTHCVIKAKNHTLLQLLSMHVCKNVYFMSLSTLASILRSISYLSFREANFFNVFIPLFMKHIADLKNVDILNITQAYNKQKIQNKYFYYLLGKQYQSNNVGEKKNSSPKITLIG